MADKRYRDYADFLGDRFDTKMQKLSVNTGRSCPNRDGTIGRGGCTYCNNMAFTPGYCLASDSVAVQLEKRDAFFRAQVSADAVSCLFSVVYVDSWRI